MEIKPLQDQNILPPAMADRNWDHTRPVPPAVANAERLAKKSQTVRVTNTHQAQTHIIYDRRMQPIEIKPQQTRECDLLVEDIEYFREERKPGRIGSSGLIRPLHPLVIESISDRIVSEDEQRDAAAKSQQAKSQQARRADGNV